MEQEAKSQQIQMQADEMTLQGKYANLVKITHTSEEFWLDFIAILPEPRVGKLLSRVIVSPAHAKRILRVLHENIRKYEETFGSIKESAEQPPKVEIVH
jgi:hypothetical protein